MVVKVQERGDSDQLCSLQAAINEVLGDVFYLGSVRGVAISDVTEEERHELDDVPPVANKMVY